MFLLFYRHDFSCREASVYFQTPSMQSLYKILKKTICYEYLSNERTSDSQRHRQRHPPNHDETLRSDLEDTEKTQNCKISHTRLSENITCGPHFQNPCNATIVRPCRTTYNALSALGRRRGELRPLPYARSMRPAGIPVVERIGKKHAPTSAVIGTEK